MRQEPIIVAGEEGRYLLSLSSAFKEKKRKLKYTDRLK
jgi:predicted  nucleic acid-binding Zn-ribbon protein